MWRHCRIGEVDENPLAVTKRCHPHQRADGLDVAARLADEAAHVGVGQLDLDRDGPGAPLKGFHKDLLRFLGQGFRHVLDECLVVHTRTGWTFGTITPETTAVETASTAAKITPCRSTSLRVAQGSPPASTGSARLRWAGRPADRKS